MPGPTTFALALLLSTQAAAPDPTARLEEALGALRDSSRRGGYVERLLPPDFGVERVERRGDGHRVVLTGDWGPDPALAANPAAAGVTEELRLESLLGLLSASEIEGGVEFLVRAPDGGLRRLGGTARHRIPGTRAPRPAIAPKPSPRLPLGGALAGRRIAISAGHGWISDDGGATWRTQRSRWDFTGCGSCRGITEDFFNADLVTHWIIPVLENMGAEVVLVREPDHSLLPPALVDDGDAGHLETGSWAAGNNPGGWGDDYRTSASGSGGAASFRASFAAAGARRVALRWLEGSNRATVAVAEVRHAGGSSYFDLDQTRMGRQWLDLGSFWFPAGTGEVVLTNPGAGYLVADAVKFGGGSFSSAGKPWWQMAAYSYVPASGSTIDLTGLDDVSIRPLRAEEVGADLFLSIHGNASGTSPSRANGTSSYRYSCQTYENHTGSDDAVTCDDPPGSRRALDLVHRAMLARLRAEWDPNWRDRGRLVANFGELRNLAGIPGVLVETGFFDNQENPIGTPPPKYPDNRSMHDPRWREALAYGLADGVAAYFNESAKAPPARPDGLRAVNQPDGSLLLSWNPVAGAGGYLVSLIDGVAEGRERAWDAGRRSDAAEIRFEDLAPRRTYAFRVSAFDQNGVGLPSQAVVARVRGARNFAGPAADGLWVGAYDRRDAWVQEIDNDFGYAVEHGGALAAGGDGFFFDGALDEAVEAGEVELTGYRLIDFAAGKDSVEHEAISATMRPLLEAFLAAGGRLIVSGEEIGYDLVEKGSAEEGAFFAGALQASYLADDAETYTLVAVPGGPFDGLTGLAFDDGTHGIYEVRYPDVLGGLTGQSRVALTYPDGRGAAVAGDRTLLFGMPLETVYPYAARAALFARAVAHLLPGLPQGDLDLDGASDACEERWSFDPRDGSDGALDADGDGATNAQECAAGTNPRGEAEWDAGTPDSSVVVTDAGEGWDGGPAFDAGPDAGQPLDAGAADSGAGADAAIPDAAVADSGEPADAGAEPHQPVAAEADGCGCKAGAGSSPLSLLAAAALALGRRRRLAGAALRRD